MINVTDVYSLIAFIILIIVISAVIFLIIRKNHLTIQKGDFSVKIGKKELQKPLHHRFTEHHIFHDLQKWEDVDIRHLEVKSKLKKILVVEFLKLFFSTSREVIYQYVSCIDQDIVSGVMWRCDESRNLSIRIMKIVEEKSKTIEIKNGNRVMVGIPQIFVDKFHHWHYPVVEMCTISLSHIVNNELFHDENSKLLAILEIFFITFRLTIFNAKESINELNGELEAELKCRLGEMK